MDSTLSPGSKEFGKLRKSLAREPGELDGASPSMVDGRQPWEGDEPQATGYAVEKADAGMVPKKSAKTRVTPVESMEGRAAAKGKSAARNTPPAQDGTGVLTELQRIGERARKKPTERWTNLLSHIKVPLLKEAYQRLRKNAASGVDGVTIRGKVNWVLDADTRTYCKAQCGATTGMDKPGSRPILKILDGSA
ncbi:MAG TPA: hypothetical protein VI197_08710 [Polyangiaceae bacterium]